LRGRGVGVLIPGELWVRFGRNLFPGDGFGIGLAVGHTSGEGEGRIWRRAEIWLELDQDLHDRQSAAGMPACGRCGLYLVERIQKILLRWLAPGSFVVASGPFK